ncbi:MAG: hypothetical protein QNJ94_20710 [Alphaproteobacteria bacterium]|nr:hypothetical protein [Alphaproteobacteria bacterium]
MTRGALAALLISAAAASPAAADELEITGNISAETRLFPFEPIHKGQRRHLASLYGEVEYYQEWTDSGDSLTIKPFYRYDSSDPRRTHFDLREAFWLKVMDVEELGRFEFRTGVDKVFWGVTESIHLVDIINQTDLVEYPDREEKLGQPMLQLSVARDWGTVDLFVLTGFRERTFPGRSGRLRSALVVNTDTPQYESGAEDRHIDFAARYSHAIDELDFGLSWFRGTSRDPALLPGRDRGGGLVLIPFYQQIDQGGIDAQYTTGPWLLKFEGLYREGQLNRSGKEQRYWASVAGFEYTFFGIFGSNMDLGVLAEHIFDSRDEEANTFFFGNAAFAGVRWTANDPQDTELLFGYLQDVNTPGKNFFVEASRRFGDSWTLSLEAQIVSGTASDSFLADLRRDDYIQLGWTYSF